MIRTAKTENGIVRGLPAADPRITTYKGIPFADKPIGQNRWRAPQPCPNWEGVRDCFEFGPIAMQANCAGDPAKDIYAREWAVDPTLPMSEDCLYLNIWAPADGRANMPVYVWYFGGGLQVGNTTEMEFDGERIARRGIVVVTVGYRLNAFGFLAHPEITKESPDAPANFGFLDQQCATRWVKRNIAAFGGNPDNITIGGQSAGGMSVLAQITSPQNKGLFSRAIVQSGAFLNPYGDRFGLFPKNMQESEAQGVRFFEALGVKTLAEARALDARTIENKSLEWPWGCWGEAVDGVFSLYPSVEWFLHPDRIQCPMLLGETSSEFFVSPRANTHAELEALADSLFAGEKDAFLSFFKDSTDIQKDGSIHSISFAIRAANCINQKKGISQPLYAYEFDAEIPGWDNPGTFHSVDLWFFFETLAKCWRPFTGKHYDLARNMCDYWANFIKTGTPNGKGSLGTQLPLWPALSEDAPAKMYFGDDTHAVPWTLDDKEEFLMREYIKRET